MATLTDRIAVIIDATSSGAVKELESLQREAKKSGDSFDTLGQKIGLAGNTIKAGLAAGASALIGGGLIKLLNDSVDAFVNSQEAARQWASLSNSSIQEAGKFTTLLKNYGIELNDLVEINAEFNKKIKEQPDLLAKYNIQIAKAEDGTVDMTATLKNAISEISKIKDGTVKAGAAMELFGEEGGKQLMPIILAGRDIQEAMEKINFVDNSNEAKEFAANTQELALSFEQAQIQLGNFLVPYLNDLMDIASGVVEFFSTLPGWVVDTAEALGIAVGSVLAFKGAMQLMKSEAVGQVIYDLIIGLGKIPAAFMLAEGAAGKFQLTMMGLKAALATVAPIAVITALVEIGLAAKKSSDQLNDLMTDTVQVSKGLDAMATSAIESGNWLEDIRSAYRNWDPTTLDAVAQKTQEISTNLFNNALATAESATATDEQKQAAQELLQVMGTQSIEQQQLNLKTEEGQAAWMKYAGAMAGADATTVELAAATASLDDKISDIVRNGGDAATTWQDIADAASEASKKQLLAKQATELSEIAMGKFAASIQGVVEWQQRLAGIPKSIEEAKGAIQDASEAWKQAKDDPATWEDETVIAMANAKTSIYDFIGALSEAGDTPLEIQTNLEELKANLPPELAAVVDEAIAQIQDKQNEIPIDLEFQENIPQLEADLADLRSRLAAANAAQDWQLAESLTREIEEIDPNLLPSKIKQAIADGNFALADKLEGEWNAWALEHGGKTVDFTINADGTAALTTVDDLTTGKSSTITYNADGTVAKETQNDLTEDKEATIKYNTSFEPGGYNAVKARLDYIASFDGKTPDINVWVHFNPGGYEAIRARLDNIARDRTANIRISTSGLAAAESAMNSLNVNTTQRVIIPQWEAPTPVNIVKVNVDGQSLRATIRDELLRVRRSDDLVAAMGVVA